MMVHAVQLLTAFIGSLGFAILFHVPKNHLFSASLGGFFSWGIYLFGVDVGLGIFLSCLFASAFSALYAEILARVKRAPAVLFFIPAVIPLVPGSNLYYTMLGIGTEDWVSAKVNAVLTLQYALSIALGISVMWAVLSIARSIREKRNAS
ncbi:MAG: threonine/serine exporter family protein [Solobacterium sp.]|jgi:uncharacterized membrane protein YjjB (DUF3815 family)|nr:threonine/serine exporter family protein [Solobacterium sp.]